jgi:predicted nucleotidyltransferase component of viral defense system
MRNEIANFHQLVELALKSSNMNTMRPVIEKELLHYDILFCLDSEGLLNQLTFQGGTSLRLCYGGTRLSEDLDFAGGVDFTAKKLNAMKDCIETYISSRYALEVLVKEPNELKKDPAYAEITIDVWQIAVITHPEKKDLPRQKIKLEVANIPAYTSEPRSLLVNYDFLPNSYSDMLITTETLNEILADKMISLSAQQRYIRYRDIWDIPWLIQQGAKIDSALVEKKLQDYKLTHFDKLLEARIQSLPTIITGNQLSNEMRRFIPTDVFDRTLATDRFKQYLINTHLEQHMKLKNILFGKSEQSESEFKM